MQTDLLRAATQETATTGAAIMTTANRISSLLLMFLGLALWSGWQSGAVTQATDQPLVPGTLIEREITQEQPHQYSIRLAAREALRVAATQKYGAKYKTNLILTATASNGRAITEVNLFDRDEGAETMTVIAEADDVYVISLRLADNSDSPGAYQLQAQPPQPATSADAERVSAQNAFQSASKLRQTGKREDKIKAIELAENAQRTWATLGETLWEGETLNLIGVLRRELEGPKEALTYFNRALSLIEKSGARHAQAVAQTNACLVLYDLSQYQKALSCQQAVLQQAQELNEQGLILVTKQSLAASYTSLGERDLALQLFNSVLAEYRTHKLAQSEALTLNNLGVFHASVNEYQQALEYYEQALSVRRKIGSPRQIAISLYNLGALYSKLNDKPKAAEYYREALDIFRQRGNNIEVCHTLNGLAITEAEAENYDKALAHLSEALSLARQHQLPLPEAYALIHHSRVYISLQQWEKARATLQQGLEACRRTDDRACEAIALNQLGRVALGLRQPIEARKYFEEDHRLARALGDIPGEVAPLTGLAQVAALENELPRALQFSQQALELIESTRSKIFKTNLRASFFAGTQTTYQTQIEILQRMHEQQPSAGYAAQAFAVSERARARSLLDTLTESGVDIRAGVAPELLAEETKLRLQLNQREQARLAALSKKNNAASAAALGKEVVQLLSDYETVKAKIRQASPRYAALTQPQPLTVVQLQRLLDPDTLLLEFALGEKRSTLWVVTTEAVTSFALPGAAQIEAAASKCFNLLKDSKQRRWQHAAELAAQELSQMLLRPAFDALRSSQRKRLVVVADGVLQYIPFGTLPLPNDKAAPLLARFEIVSLPSASVLAALRGDLKERAPSAKPLAIFSDPVFQADDPRLKSASLAAASASTMPEHSQRARQLTRAAEDLGLNGFARLPYARQEAEAILALSRDPQNLQAFDFAASRATALNAKLEEYRILHFATHSLLNPQHPELSGIALSLVDEKGRPQDGFLRLTDLYNLKLNAELVVLSACQTAMGKKIKGEGIIGLTRGFMYAGAPRIVASLWDVNDLATAELMRRFYRSLLKEKLPPAAALRAAQLSLSKESRWAAPYYWAGFVMQGDWQATSQAAKRRL
jgi:CHAT domain-containing protein/tetratricopeptide (TPR) repeat protein